MAPAKTEQAQRLEQSRMDETQPGREVFVYHRITTGNRELTTNGQRTVPTNQFSCFVDLI